MSADPFIWGPLVVLIRIDFLLTTTWLMLDHIYLYYKLVKANMYIYIVYKIIDGYTQQKIL